jgi:hypothetical protein
MNSHNKLIPLDYSLALNQPGIDLAVDIKRALGDRRVVGREERDAKCADVSSGVVRVVRAARRKAQKLTMTSSVGCRILGIERGEVPSLLYATHSVCESSCVIMTVGVNE